VVRWRPRRLRGDADAGGPPVRLDHPGRVVNPADVFPFVFHGWLLVAVFVLAAWTGFGREYTVDRIPEEVARV
jgi:hypothetical protein